MFAQLLPAIIVNQTVQNLLQGYAVQGIIVLWFTHGLPVIGKIEIRGSVIVEDYISK